MLSLERLSERFCRRKAVGTPRYCYHAIAPLQRMSLCIRSRAFPASQHKKCYLCKKFERGDVDLRSCYSQQGTREDTRAGLQRAADRQNSLHIVHRQGQMEPEDLLLFRQSSTLEEPSCHKARSSCRQGSKTPSHRMRTAHGGLVLRRLSVCSATSCDGLPQPTRQCTCHRSELRLPPLCSVDQPWSNPGSASRIVQ